MFNLRIIVTLALIYYSTQIFCLDISTLKYVCNNTNQTRMSTDVCLGFAELLLMNINNNNNATSNIPLKYKSNANCCPSRCAVAFLKCENICTCEFAECKCCTDCANCFGTLFTDCCDCVFPKEMCSSN